MTGRSGVLCVGTVVYDESKVIDAYPALDHLATIEEISASPGGGALNMAVDLRQLGARFPIDLLAAVGDDEKGEFLLRECARLGIGTAGVRRYREVSTSFVDAMVERVGGRRTFFLHVGANDVFEVPAEVVDGSSARILHFGIPGLHPRMDAEGLDGHSGWYSLLERARGAGMAVNMELAGLRPERMRQVVMPLLPLIDSVICNELEAGVIADLPVEVPGADDRVDWARLEQIARRIVAFGVRRIVVVHFPAGAVAVSSDGRAWRQGSVALPKDEVRSTIAAGDAFAAGVLLGLHDDWDVVDALRLGAASAAACVRSPHNAAGIKPAAVCLADAEAFGYRAT